MPLEGGIHPISSVSRHLDRLKSDELSVRHHPNDTALTRFASIAAGVQREQARERAPQADRSAVRVPEQNDRSAPDRGHDRER
jgi:hypothetical protein